MNEKLATVWQNDTNNRWPENVKNSMQILKSDLLNFDKKHISFEYL